MKELAGARARIVWVQEIGDTGKFANRELKTALIGLDTDDGKGERLILPRAGYYSKPLLTSDGNRIVFSEIRRGIPRVGDWKPGEKVMVSRTRNVAARVVNWDGSRVRTIAPGYAIEVWKDPATGKEWVYVQAGSHHGDDFHRNAIYRYPLDGPGQRELVWDKTPVDAIEGGSFQLSADGERAVGLFPWPEAGVIDLKNKTWKRIGTGCWTAMAPDNSHRTWIFNGSHRSLIFGAADGRTTSKVDLTTAVGMKGSEAYHPRWSNHPRFFVMTGPYRTSDGDRMNGGREVEVIAGRFNDTFTKVESWVTVTANGRGDYFPDMWVDRKPDDEPGAAAAIATTESEHDEPAWPGDSAGLVFLWENGAGQNEVFNPETQQSRQCRTEMHGMARYGRYFTMELAGGGGTFSGDGGETEMMEAFRGGSELTLEANIEAAASTTQPIPIIQLSAPGEPPGFVLEQDGDLLVFRVRVNQFGTTSERRLEIGTIALGTAHHVAIVYAHYGRIEGYLDGHRVAEADLQPGSFREWPRQRLQFGGDEHGASWSGRLDGIALYATTLDENQIAAHAALNAARCAGRADPDRAVVLATLREMTPTPSPAAIAPYRRCLVVYRYDVDEVLDGHLEGKTVQVAHWAILDAKTLPEFHPRVGATYRLELEAFEAHPELESERIDTSRTDFDAPLYFDPMPWHGDYSTAAREVKTPSAAARPLAAVRNQ